MKKSNLKIVFIHGNGGGKSTDHWFPQVIQKLKGWGYKVDARDFPDAEAAHENIWIPFLKNDIKAGENTIIVGHSSGAVAANRFAEENKIFASVLVGVNYTDIGDETEKQSGYYSRPWNWKKIKANQNWVIQFASTDDPYIPISEPRFIHEQLNSEYYEFENRGHFMVPEFPELIEVMRKKLDNIL